jgi:hypothetical protein
VALLGREDLVRLGSGDAKGTNDLRELGLLDKAARNVSGMQKRRGKGAYEGWAR